jgi:hypothetical protein
MSFFDKMKKAGKGVVDAGAKQMLKVRCAFFVPLSCVSVTLFICSVLLAHTCYVWAVPNAPKSDKASH